MAKPMSPTPEVTGKIAKQIQNELRNGTKDTPRRIDMIKRADEAFRSSMEPMLRKRSR